MRRGQGGAAGPARWRRRRRGLPLHQHDHGVRPAALPARHEGAVGGARYRFTSATSAYDEVALPRLARDLRRRCAGSPRALVGVFPGSPDALTVLTGRDVRGGWAWSSWHVDPGAGEVVRTRSTLVVA